MPMMKFFADWMTSFWTDNRETACGSRKEHPLVVGAIGG